MTRDDELIAKAGDDLGDVCLAALGTAVVACPLPDAPEHLAIVGAVAFLTAAVAHFQARTGMGDPGLALACVLDQLVPAMRAGFRDAEAELAADTIGKTEGSA